MTLTSRIKVAVLALFGAALVTVGPAWIGYQVARGDAPYVLHVSDTSPVLLAQAEIPKAEGGPLTAGVEVETGSAAPSAATTAPTAAVPDPAEQPVESASLLYKLYKAGHLIPAIILFSFFALTLLQRWIAWLRTGYRKLVVTSVLGGLAMLAERAADGTTPNLTMLMGAVGVALALWTNGKGEAKA